MNSYIFQVVIEAGKFDDGEIAYHAHCPALPDCHASGHTSEEALANIRKAVELYAEDLRGAGKSIPVDALKCIKR